MIQPKENPIVIKREAFEMLSELDNDICSIKVKSDTDEYKVISFDYTNETEIKAVYFLLNELKGKSYIKNKDEFHFWCDIDPNKLCIARVDAEQNLKYYIQVPLNAFIIGIQTELDKIVDKLTYDKE